jgi:hypothetical protein
MPPAELLVRRIADRTYGDEYFFVTGDLNLRADEWPVPPRSRV